FVVSKLIFELMAWYMAFVLSIAGLSGIAGGFLAWMIFRMYEKVFPRFRSTSEENKDNDEKKGKIAKKEHDGKRQDNNSNNKKNKRKCIV
ncbi:MAG: hypothetical protein QW728_02860, partial [Thermoplasmata archaeon]